MKKMFLFIIIFLTIVSLSACQLEQSFDITTANYPAYDLAQNIAGNKLKVKMLIKPGVEVHDFSPSSREISNVKTSKLFIFASYDLDLWLNNNEKSILGESTISLNLSNYLNLDNLKDDHSHDHLHFWTDPLTYINLIDAVLLEIIKIDETNQNYYIENAKKYQEELSKQHFRLLNYLKNKDPLLFFSGHNSLNPFSERYGINIVSLSNDTKPDADFTLTQIINLLEEIRANDIHYLFIEELSEAKIAKTLQNELKSKNYYLEILELHGYHNLTKEDFNNQVRYLDLFIRNIENIMKAVK